MKNLFAALSILLFTVFSIAFGQDKERIASAARDEDEPVIKVTTTNINLPVTVFNDKGKFVPNLKRDDFRIFENNNLQPIIEFHPQTNIPLRAAILMDTSTSVRNRLEFEKIAIKNFIGSVLRDGRDRVAFYTFDDSVKMQVDFTNALPDIVKSVDEIKAIGGRTSLYDVIYKVCREKMNRNDSHRRVLIVISDGADTNSSHSLQQAITIAQGSETSIYAISTKGGAVFRTEGTPYLNADDRELRKLCRDTGGEIFFPNNPEELGKAFQLVTDFLRNQYLLVYEPSSAGDGKFHEIEVRLPNRKGLYTLARKGYFAK